MTITLRTIDLNIFPVNKTIFGLLKEEKERYKNIKTEIESWGGRFPNVKVEAVAIIATPTMTYDDYLTQFNKYNLENNYIKPANADALKEINELFKVNETDNDLIKFLKEIANNGEQKALLEASFEDLRGGVIWVVFLLETFKNFYLSYLPTYINEKLNHELVITLGEVKEKLKPVLLDTFATLYSSFVKVEQESDLEQLKTDTNNNLEKIKKVIYDYRDSKKPNEPEKPAEDVEGIKAKLKEWTDKFPDKTPQQVFDNQEKHKPEDLKPVNEDAELGLDGEDEAVNQIKKNLITEIKRLCQLKNITPHFYKDKDKVPQTTTPNNIHLWLNQTDNNGFFSSELVLLSVAQELAHLETNSREKTLIWWKELDTEQKWVKDNLSSDYQKPFDLLFKPSYFPIDRLDINKVLVVNDLENITATSSESFSVSRLLIDKCWQIVKDKALELEVKAVVNAVSLSADYTITINYNSDSSHVKELERLMIETPLKAEIEYLKERPTAENYNRLIKQNDMYDEYLNDLAPNHYDQIKEKINKIN